MNLDGILNNFLTLGPVFWAGAVAIAIGATLLVVSVLTMLRRLKLVQPKIGNPFLKKWSGQKSPRSKKSRVLSAETVRKTDSGYEPTAFPIQNANSHPAKTSGQVPFELTDRLHQAANTLEEIILGLQKENHSPGFSLLKEDRKSVDHLFKTTFS